MAKAICPSTLNCPVEATIQLIGGKYKAVLLWHLMSKTLRYSELHRLLPKATDKMLAQQLRELESDGLIQRTVYPVVPPKTEYSLTEFGVSLAPILDAMCNWGTSYLEKNYMDIPCKGSVSK
jgi:Predicted transcriptional regulators